VRFSVKILSIPGRDSAAIEPRNGVRSTNACTATTRSAQDERPQPDWALVHRELRRPNVTLILLWEEDCDANFDSFISSTHTRVSRVRLRT
jgi:transposase